MLFASTYNLRVEVIAGLMHASQRERDNPNVAGMGDGLGRGEEDARQEHRERERCQHNERKSRIESTQSSEQI